MKKQKLKKKKYIPQKLNTDIPQTVLDKLAIGIDDLNKKLFELENI